VAPAAWGRAPGRTRLWAGRSGSFCRTSAVRSRERWTGRRRASRQVHVLLRRERGSEPVGAAPRRARLRRRCEHRDRSRRARHVEHEHDRAQGRRGDRHDRRYDAVSREQRLRLRRRAFHHPVAAAREPVSRRGLGEERGEAPAVGGLEDAGGTREGQRVRAPRHRAPRRNSGEVGPRYDSAHIGEARKT
jgi:hypothetical protein